MKVAVLGLGAMGAAIARRIEAAGLELSVYNRSPAATAEFSERRARRRDAGRGQRRRRHRHLDARGRRSRRGGAARGGGRVRGGAAAGVADRHEHDRRRQLRRR